MKSFKQRTADFWQWFEENEAKLEDYIANIRNISSESVQEVIDFVAEGLNIAIDGCLFELGGL